MVHTEFWNWLSIESKKWLWLFGVATLVQIALSLVKSANDVGLAPKELPFSALLPHVPWVAALAQALILLLLFFVIGMVAPPERSLKSPAANAATSQFTVFWNLNWGCWILLYFVLALHNGIEAFGSGANVFWIAVIQNLLSNLNTLFQVMCFIVLYTITVEEDGKRKGWLMWGLLCGFLVIGSLLAIDVGNYFCIGEQQKHNAKAMSWLIGGLAGVALALLVGRLDSKLLGAPICVIVIGHLYAVVQIGYASFDNKVVQIVLTTYALIAKLTLIFYISWIIQSGLIGFYMREARNAIIVRNGERKRFIISCFVNDPKTLLETLVREQRKINVKDFIEVLMIDKHPGDPELLEIAKKGGKVAIGDTEFTLQELTVNSNNQPLLVASDATKRQKLEEKTMGWKLLFE